MTIWKLPADMLYSVSMLPAELYAPIPRKLTDLQVGETSYLDFSALHVNHSGRCFLRPGANLVEKDSLFPIQVERKPDGYHVTIIKRDKAAGTPRWSPGEVSADYYPVASVTLPE